MNPTNAMIWRLLPIVWQGQLTVVYDEMHKMQADD